MLGLSTKYALRALRCLAETDGEDYVSVDTLSEKSDVPRPYLAKLMKLLAEKKIVNSKKGVNGGVKFASKKSLSFYDICVALNDPVANQRCLLSNEACGRGAGEFCSLHKDWSKQREALINFLKNARIN